MEYAKSKHWRQPCYQFGKVFFVYSEARKETSEAKAGMFNVKWFLHARIYVFVMNKIYSAFERVYILKSQPELSQYTDL